MWFISEARSRSLIADLVLDLDEHPGEVDAGAVVASGSGSKRQVLVIRTRAAGWELPEGGIDWDELPGEAAARVLEEEAGAIGDLQMGGALGHRQYLVGGGSERHLRRVIYYAAESGGRRAMGDLPDGTLERRWLRREELDSASLVSEDLRCVLRSAQERT